MAVEAVNTVKPLGLSARARLTILYTCLVFAAGLVLTGLVYILMRRRPEPTAVFVQLNDSATQGSSPPPPPDADELIERVRSATLADFLVQAGIALAVVTLLAAVLGWLIAGRVLRPIQLISATAERLSAENLAERIPVTKPDDELAALAGTVNGMLDRLQRGVAERDRVLESQRLFTANAAHELRTPLTTVRTAIDVTLEGSPGPDELTAMALDVRAATVRSQQILDELLVLANSQAGLGERRALDLAVVLGKVLDAVDTADFPVRRNLGATRILGVPILIERMAGNLVDNAVRYNRRGGSIDVSCGSDDDEAWLRIANTGRVIPDDRVAGLLEPFVRGDASRTRGDGGLGLGLSIVRAIVVAHQGSLEAAARPEAKGGGLDITIRLPCQNPAFEPGPP